MGLTLPIAPAKLQKLDPASVFETFADFIEVHGTLTFLVLAIVYVAVTAGIGAAKLLWYDELWTYYPAKFVSATTTWSFFMQGNDVHTPLASLIVRASTAVFGNNELAIRLPFILSYSLMCICIYAFVVHHCGKVFAAAAMVFPLIASTYYYATEARPYAIALGFSAATLVCWQRASHRGNRACWVIPSLCLSVAITTCAHFFGILAVFSIFCAEAVKTVSRKRLDLPVIAALVLGVAPLFIFIPGALRARRIYAGSFWAHPGIMDVANAYRDLIQLALFPVLAALILSGIIFCFVRHSRREFFVSFPSHEIVAVTLLALLPVYTLPIFLALGAFVPRYLLYTIVGLTIGLAMIAYRATHGNRLFGSVLLVVFVGWFLFKAPGTIRADIAERGNILFESAHPFKNTNWMAQIARSSLPVVIAPAVFYLQLQHYAPPGIKERIYYLLSKQDALRYSGTNTGELNLEILSRVMPIHAVSYEAFVAQQHHFLICADVTTPTWIIHKLTDNGVSLRLIAREDTHFLFDSELRPR